MKKLASYILILFILVGIFIPAISVYAGPGDGTQLYCWKSVDGGEEKLDTTKNSDTCKTNPQNPTTKYRWGGVNSTGGAVDGNGQVISPKEQPKNEFEYQYQNNALGVCYITDRVGLQGCAVGIFYILFYTIPTFLLTWSAYFFNAIIGISVNSTLMTASEFLPSAWAVIRDLSNIFFILILIYIAVEMILGIGGHGVKKAITQVIIMALLINFSMFFTKVVIDSSNIIALVFYNKMNVNTRNSDTTPRRYNDGATGTAEKDIAGGMVNAFNPASALTWNNFFEEAKKDPITGGPANASNTVPAGITLGILLVTGAVMLFATYAFFVSGVSFMGRFIELWVLIIFSPFAFMSSTIPLLKKIEYVGWDAWFHRLLSCAFMAPIFMFFMYFIFLLIRSNIFNTLIDPTQRGMMATLLGIAIPAMILVILLLKATDFAKQGGGKIAETFMNGAKMLGGLALGAATGGAALLGTGLIGGAIAGSISKSSGEKLKEQSNEKGFKGFGARLALKALDKTQKATFDVRQTGAGKAFGSTLGLDLNRSKIIGLGTQEGGFKGRVERKAKALHEESELYKTGKTDEEVKQYSIKRIAEYEEKKADALRRGVSEEKFVADHGYKPKSVETAAQLNNERMKAFINNLGQSDLLGTLAFEMALGKVNRGNFKNNESYKKAYKETTGEEMKADAVYDEKIAKKVNDPKVAQAKMVIGAAASLGTGGLAGAYTAALLGGTGAAIAGSAAAGATVGGAGAFVTKITDAKGEGKFASDHEKEHAKLHKVEDRIHANEASINKITELMQSFVELGKKANPTEHEKQYVGMVTQKDGKISIDQSKVEDAIASLAFEAQRNNLRLKELVDQGKAKNDPEMTALRVEFMRNSTETARVTKLRTAEADKNNLLKQNIDLGESKQKIEEAHAPAAHAPAAHAAPAPAAHAPAAHAPAPAAHAPADHGGGHEAH